MVVLRFILAGAMLMMMLVAAQSHALLMGEKAKNAPISGLKAALLRYKQGETHDSVWQHHAWYCPFRNRTGCRWEVAGNCTSANYLNITALKHTFFVGKIPLWKFFNAACVWQHYPSLKNQIFIYYEGTRDAAGICGFENKTNVAAYAYVQHSQNGNPTKGICIKSSNFRSISDIQKKELHLIFLHEIQHHIQFIEGGHQVGTYCPYRRQMLEVEAYHVQKRELLGRKEKREQAPTWFVPGLC